MKLLFDENVSAKLVVALASEYPDSAHIRNVGLLGASDQRIWDYARAAGFAIVSKDTDFRERSYVSGFPPKIIWLDVGDSTTSVIVELLRSHHARIARFETEDTSLLILSIGANAV